MSSVSLAATAKGTAGSEGATAAFSTIISSAGNAHNGSSVTMRLQSGGTSDIWQAVRRGFWGIDPTTVSVPSGFIITAATLTLVPGTIPTDTFVQSICITAAVMADPLIGTADADYQGTASSRTEYTSRIAIADMTISVGQVFTFNAAGLAYLTTQFTSGDPIVLGARWSCDVDQTSPTWSSSVTEDINLTASAAALSVTYRVGPGHAVVSLTGTLGNAADTVNASLFTVELFT